MKLGFRLLGILIVLGMVIFALSSFWKGDSVTNLAAAPATTHVHIKLFTFKPDSLEVPVGTTVVWTNGDAVEHTVTSGTPEKPVGAFDSGGFTEGKTFSFTFTKPGDYSYFCNRHNFMHGQIKVIPSH
jgi:plastocyanin